MSNKDWSGNQNSIFKTLGASNHTDKERQNEDYYATDPIAAMSIINEGNKVAMFLKVQFLEGKSWKEFFKKYPPKIVYVSSKGDTIIK